MQRPGETDVRDAVRELRARALYLRCEAAKIELQSGASGRGSGGVACLCAAAEALARVARWLDDDVSDLSAEGRRFAG